MMRFDLLSLPAKALKGDISVPGDKSISHRAVILGSIATGMTTITGFLPGEDCVSTMSAFRAMGVSITHQHDNVDIKGVGMHGLEKPQAILDCGNSGTTMRLLAGLLAAQSFNTALDGDDSLRKRPMARVASPLNDMGASIETRSGCAPLTITGGKSLTGIHYQMPHASAQVKSAVLLAGLYAKGTTTVVEPAPTRDHTERLLQAFGYPMQVSTSSVTLDGGGECVGTHVDVPKDFSSAAFFIVAATIVPGSAVRINHVGVNPTRTGLLFLLKEMGANITLENARMCGQEPVADIVVQHAELTGIEVDPKWIALAIDEWPVFCIAAAVAYGQTRLTEASELRTKESDRILAMSSGLQALGIHVTPLEDGLIIEGGTIKGGMVESFGDHRIAMAFAVAGAVATSSVMIKQAQSIATSFPDFVKTARQLGWRIEVCDDAHV